MVRTASLLSQILGLLQRTDFAAPVRELEADYFRLAASTIATICKDRSQVGLFFKLLKQQRRIKTFVGTSAKAVRIQVWAALIAVLLL